MPASKSDVQTHVLNFLSSFTGISQSELASNYMSAKLTDDPLDFDTQSLNALTLSLRGYIQSSNPSGTILAGEVRASGLTVSGLVDLVYSKL